MGVGVRVTLPCVLNVKSGMDRMGGVREREGREDVVTKEEGVGIGGE